MTRSTNMEHVEVLRDLSEVCRAAIKAGDWKVDGACDPDSLLRHADAAIASLSAPQPPAEAQAVAKLVVEKDGLVKFIRPTGLSLDLPAGEYLLHLHPSPAEAQPVGAVRRDTGVTITLDRLPYYKGVRLASGTKLYAHPPPSAPVGVDTIRDGRAIVDEFLQCASIGRPHGKLIAQAKDWLADAEAALTKQPAAVDGDDFDCPHSAFDNCDCYADQQGGSDNDR